MEREIESHHGNFIQEQLLRRKYPSHPDNNPKQTIGKSHHWSGDNKLNVLKGKKDFQISQELFWVKSVLIEH